MSLRTLLVHAHPEPASFAAAQAGVAAASLTRSGGSVDVIDLYADQWQAVLRADEFPGAVSPFKPQAEQMRAVTDGTLDPVVRDHLDRLLAADRLVLSFPLWWFSMPALMKGWIDRVFVMGGLFGGAHGLFDGAALAGRDAVLLLTTGGSREAFGTDGAFGPMDDFLFHIHRGMLEFVGYRVLEPVITYGPAHLDDDGRGSALAEVERRMLAIARTT